ncbi:hypothetical protein P3T37_002053 [Kitasatospora sp. MAA4]|uniref:esterase/lipase family protein n=1 Tax=Kitasatospora sp. MAA4 TaxID=3035093 RepID=UPI002474ED2F|nr:hypothetical protein [Kitasatospora sp. MAA4]MDH6132667.1 hypothetical protein [Kitasatospora sp. MAA4]
MSEQNEPVVEPWSFLAPQPGEEVPPAPAPDAVWQLRGGTAWVYYANSKFGLSKPVILSDGFESGPSKLDVLWDGLERGDYAFVTELRRRGYDLVLLGYDDRSASILKNADVAIECIQRTISERRGNHPLTVGGFSMGGLVTRYALAKMETEQIRHETAVYLSYDSPHRGAWIPIALQALAHFLKATPALSQQINSDAARQLLWRHISTTTGTPEQDQLRTEFLDELESVGNWPQLPRKIGVANGSGTGDGNGVKPGLDAVKVTSGYFAGTTLRTQSSGSNQEVARLKGLLTERSITTNGLPELDGAPGGTLESFGIAGRKLKITGKTEVEPSAAWVCFVPAVSAVAIRDLDKQTDLYTDINALPKVESELDDFLLSSENTPHSKMTEELGSWILDRLPK